MGGGEQTDREGVDPSDLRRVLGAFVTGVTVITTVDERGRDYGLTVNSFSSVSLNPPLILWSQSLTAPSYPVFHGCQSFAVNILADDQEAISQRFAGAERDKFSGVATSRGLGGVPLLSGCLAYLECSKVTSYPGGDHSVYLGLVVRIDRTLRRPLAFADGRYLKLT